MKLPNFPRFFGEGMVEENYANPGKPFSFSLMSLFDRPDQLPRLGLIFYFVQHVLSGFLHRVWCRVARQ